MGERNVPFDKITESLKRAAAVLRDADVEFLLGGSIAAWARGGSETTNDIDLMVRREDAERALDALAAAGMRPEHPPEGWLLKAWDGEVMIDLIFELSRGLAVDDDLFARAEECDVLAMRMPVMNLEDVIVTKLNALHEHLLDFEPLVRIARALRERVDWPQVRARTSDNPYAGAYFALLTGLDIVSEDDLGGGIGVPAGQRETHAFHPEAEPYR